METMRDVLRRELGRSLRALPELDRVRAAWPVACGKAMAGRGEPVRLEDGGRLVVEVDGAVWLDEMRGRRAVLERELGRISGVKLSGIHFELRPAGSRPGTGAGDAR